MRQGGADGVQLRVEALLDQACHQTGLSDYGDRWFIAPLTHLVEMINREAGLPSADVWPVQQLVGWIGDRLKLVEYVKRNPKVHDEKLDVRGVIMAARGGSTLLQRLLGSSPQLTSCRTWELISPVPLKEEKPDDPSARIRYGHAWLEAFRHRLTGFDAVHPVDAMAFDEENNFMDRAFLSLNLQSWFNIPSYLPWQMAYDQTKNYEELVLWLKVLQYQSPERKGRKWILKSIQHSLGGMRTMLTTFPGAKAIMTHRRVDQMIPSLCSSQSMLIRPSQCANFDKRELGQRLARMYKDAFTDMVKVRAETPAERFVDVQYRDLISDPLGQFRHLMELMGLTVDQRDERAASDWLEENRRGSFPTHEYDLREFGLDQADLDETFKFYHDAFVK